MSYICIEPFYIRLPYGRDDHSLRIARSREPFIFFIDQRIETHVEAKLHQHDAWELYYVLHGYGTRMAGDTLQSFSAGDVALIPPSMHHYWEYTLYRQTVTGAFIT